jgi:hypothetical protein
LIYGQQGVERPKSPMFQCWVAELSLIRRSQWTSRLKLLLLLGSGLCCPSSPCRSLGCWDCRRSPHHACRRDIVACETLKVRATSACASPLASLWIASCRWCGVSAVGRPNFTPRSLARFLPSPVRARISSLSNSASPPSTVSISRPCAVVVSAQVSFRLRKPACPSPTECGLRCDKHSRPILQALRLQSFLKLKTYMRQSNRVRLKVRISKAQSTRLDSNRLSHDLIQRPHFQLRTRGAMHWR